VKNYRVSRYFFIETRNPILYSEPQIENYLLSQMSDGIMLNRSSEKGYARVYRGYLNPINIVILLKRKLS
jgi:hypothetical protein